MHRTSFAMLLMGAALICSAAHAQRARCVNASGVGYECSGSEAAVQHQNLLSGQQPRRNELKFNLNTPNQQGRDMFARPAADSSGLSHDAMQQRLQQMDAAAAAARSDQGNGPRP